MTSDATTPQEYMDSLPEDRKAAMHELRQVISENIPEEFSEVMSYGMIGYVIPHSIYPAGYHCNPAMPLPFINIASQKNFIAVYHMGLYADPGILEWFITEFAKYSKAKPDMGKGCIRFKKPGQIPFKLIGELSSKMSANEWIRLYEEKVKK